MIDARELRIGNLVYYTNDIPDPITQHIITIGLPELFEIEKDHSSFDYIPITEEWLVNFGFKFRIASIQGQDSWAGFGTWELDGIYFQGTRRGDVIYFNRMNTTEKIYVHQLQNLYFALTGEELTFKS